MGVAVLFYLNANYLGRATMRCCLTKCAAGEDALLHESSKL